MKLLQCFNFKFSGLCTGAYVIVASLRDIIGIIENADLQLLIATRFKILLHQGVKKQSNLLNFRSLISR